MCRHGAKILKQLIAALACLPMLCSPSFASDWVEEGIIETDAGTLQSPLPTSVMVPSQTISTPEVADGLLNMDLADFTPGYIPTSADMQEAPTRKPKAMKAASMVLALAQTETAVGLPVRKNVAVEWRLRQLESTCGLPPNKGHLKDRLNEVRRHLQMPDIPKGKWDWFWNPPDNEVLDAMGRGVRAGGKALVRTPEAIASGTGKVLATPGVPELLLAGAVLGVGIPLIVQASKNNSSGRGGGPAIEWVEPYFRADGTYVPGHFRTVANGTVWDNWSTKGNVNPFTGAPGYKRFPSYYP